MRVMVFAFGMAIAVTVVGVWSALEGAGLGLLLLRIGASLLVLQIAYVACVAWLAAFPRERAGAPRRAERRARKITPPGGAGG